MSIPSNDTLTKYKQNEYIKYFMPENIQNNTEQEIVNEIYYGIQNQATEVLNPDFEYKTPASDIDSLAEVAKKIVHVQQKNLFYLWEALVNQETNSVCRNWQEAFYKQTSQKIDEFYLKTSEPNDELRQRFFTAVQVFLNSAEVMENLQEIEFLSFNNIGITTLPKQISKLKKLRTLDLSNTSKLVNLPTTEMKSLSQLKQVYLQNSSLPDSIKLGLVSNRPLA